MAGADDKSKKKAVNVHERLSNSLSKFKQNMEKIREITDAVDGVDSGKEPEKKQEQPK